MKNDLPVVGITMGDPVGVGPEIIHKALSDKSVYKICRPVVIGDRHVLAAAGKMVASGLEIRDITSVDNGRFEYGMIDLITMSDLRAESLVMGQPDAGTGKAMISYIEKAIKLAVDGDTSAVVTCPINKVAMKLAGSEFHGHTELLASATGTDQYLMMMYGEKLSVVLVTIHIPLNAVKNSLTSEKILETIVLTGESLRKRFGIANPRIAVSGLNPHAGEDGLFGNEEADIINPAVRDALKMGFDVEGPIPPDTVYYHAMNGRFDVVVSMYHDQGLIPFKMIHFEDGVNTTLGLPIIRTSVDHGTAYDIAGTGIAEPGSLIAAIKLAARQAGHMINCGKGS